MPLRLLNAPPAITPRSDIPGIEVGMGPQDCRVISEQWGATKTGGAGDIPVYRRRGYRFGGCKRLDKAAQIHGHIVKLTIRIFQIAQLATFVSPMYKKNARQVEQKYARPRSIDERKLFNTKEERSGRRGGRNIGWPQSGGGFTKDRDACAQRLDARMKEEDKERSGKR